MTTLTESAIAVDVSYHQRDSSDRIITFNDSYNRRWASFRLNDGTFIDPAFGANLAWCESAYSRGRLDGFVVYGVFRPGIDMAAVYKGHVGSPPPGMVAMIDIESWGGQIRGDHSAEINGNFARLASWLGSPYRVIGYGNASDLAELAPRRDARMRLIVARYSSSPPSGIPNVIGWQYTDGGSQYPVPSGLPRSSPPFGNCDHNVFPGLTSAELAVKLGVARPSSQEDALTPELKAYLVAMEARLVELINHDMGLLWRGDRNDTDKRHPSILDVQERVDLTRADIADIKAKLGS